MSLLIVGCGKMGGIILESAVKSELFSAIDVVEPSKEGQQVLVSKYSTHSSVSFHSTIPTTSHHEIALICVKPWMVKQVLNELNNVRLIGSIAAGITINDLEAMKDKVPMVRIMPNTPCQVGQGMTAIVSGAVEPLGDDLQKVISLFSTMGRVVQLPNESNLNIFTALCGSGPGLMLTILEAFADGALSQGLTKQQAIEFAAQTMLGTAQMVLETRDHPAVLRDQVCTPGGCTIVGVNSLHCEGVPGGIIKSLLEIVKRLK